MARAKRTDRAEARRRYRAYLQAQAEAEAGAGTDEADADAPASSAGRGDRRRAAGDISGPPLPRQRMGFMAAFRAAYRPLDFRGDLRLLIPLVTRTHAIWPVAALSVACAAILATDRSTDFAFAFALLVLQPPAYLPGILAGFLAPRASWLAGAIGSLIGGVAFSAIIAGGVYKLPEGSSVAFTIVGIIAYSVFFGGVFGGLAGWYKRFLALTGPAGAARQQTRGGGRKPAPRRR